MDAEWCRPSTAAGSNPAAAVAAGLRVPVPHTAAKAHPAAAVAGRPTAQPPQPLCPACLSPVSFSCCKSWEKKSPRPFGCLHEGCGVVDQGPKRQANRDREEVSGCLSIKKGHQIGGLLICICLGGAYSASSGSSLSAASWSVTSPAGRSASSAVSDGLSLA